MGPAPRSGRCTVVVDTCILVNLLHVGGLALLGGLEGYEFVVCAEVVAEMMHGDQRRELESAFQAGHLRNVSSDVLEASAAYRELRRVLDPGEAAALALAIAHGWSFATDDGAARRIAGQRLGGERIMNTAGILVAAIRSGLLSVEQADAMKTTLAANRFVMSFASFRDVL